MRQILPSRIASLVIVCSFLLFCFWWYEGNNFTTRNLSGTWKTNDKSKVDHLVLNEDCTYTQEVTKGTQVVRAQGKWRLIGNADAHIVFDGSFIDAPSAAIGQDDHNAFGMFTNFFGYLTLELQSDTVPLQFHKTWF